MGPPPNLTASRRLARVGATLDLGEVSGAYRVFLNGRKAATPDQLGSLVDLSSALRPGENTIRVRVASTLLDRLRTTRPLEFGRRPATVTGLLGPVALDPYKVVRQ